MGDRTELLDLENVDEKEELRTHTETMRTSEPGSFEV
jgi:hypothetical protein